MVEATHCECGIGREALVCAAIVKPDLRGLLLAQRAGAGGDND